MGRRYRKKHDEWVGVRSGWYRWVIGLIIVAVFADAIAVGLWWYGTVTNSPIFNPDQGEVVDWGPVP